MTQPTQPEPSPATHGVWGRILAPFVLLAIVMTSFAAQLVGWGGPLFGSAGGPQPAFAATLTQAILLLAPLALLAFTWRSPRYRAMFRTWLAAALVLLLLSPTRLIAPVEGQAALLAQGAILAVVWLILVVRGRAGLPGEVNGFTWVGAGLGLLAGVPWIIAGALGSGSDILLALVVGLLWGQVAGRIAGRFWLAPLETAGRSLGRDLFTGGFVIGAAWLILASGIGVNGLQWPLMLALPALGWAAMGLATLGRPRPAAAAWPAVAWLAASATAVCLAFVDVDGLSIQAGDPILGNAVTAALAAAGIGWLLGLIALLGRRRLTAARPTAGWLLVPVVAVGLAAWAYLAGGQTGLHDDGLFVILRDQADVSAARTAVDYDARRTSVYDTLTSHADRTQAPLRAALDRLGIEYTPYYLVNALEVRGGLAVRLWLSLRGDVAAVMPSPALRPPQGPLDTAYGGLDAPPEPQWNLTDIGAPLVWDELGATGEGIVIGQSDSGVQAEHPEFAEAYRGRESGDDYNWFDPWFGSPAPVDFGGHGTHTLGSIVGRTTGVAPGAEWIACANLPRNLGNPARYLDCMQFMLAPFPQGGDPFRDGDPLRSANVLNNSWGCPEEYEGCAPESLRPAVAALRSAGIFVVSSAGNDGPACSSLNDPIALYDEAFTVGAVDEYGDLAPFSSRGPVTADGSNHVKPDILAPGVEVLSAFPGDTYEVNSGTSMAGPHVVGVVALIWSANPSLIGNIEETERILVETARPFTGAAGSDCDSEPGGVLDNDTGAGIVDAYAAVQAAQAWR